MYVIKLMQCYLYKRIHFSIATPKLVSEISAITYGPMNPRKILTRNKIPTGLSRPRTLIRGRPLLFIGQISLSAYSDYQIELLFLGIKTQFKPYVT